MHYPILEYDHRRMSLGLTLRHHLGLDRLIWCGRLDRMWATFDTPSTHNVHYNSLGYKYKIPEICPTDMMGQHHQESSLLEMP
jgi:hypothetical protein